MVVESKTPHNMKTIKPFEVKISENHPDKPQTWRVFLDREFTAKLRVIKKDSDTKQTVLVPNAEFKILDCQHFFRQIFLGYFSDIVQAFDTLRKNVCGDDYTSLHNPIVLSSVLPAYGMFHSIQILFL